MQKGQGDGAGYVRRIVDDELDVLLEGLPAISIEGPKAVGKTATALQRAATVHQLDDPSQREILEAEPSRIVSGESPILIDEWQRLPASWDLVRRAVDRGATPGRFLLTGSATPINLPTHSGAGRIVTIRLRPMSLVERGVAQPTVSLGGLLSGRRAPVAGATTISLPEYTAEIVASGFPAIRRAPAHVGRVQLDGYLERIVERDIDELGRSVRNEPALRRWMMAYAAATATTTSFEKIRHAASPENGKAPSKPAAIPYRDALERIWVLDANPAWLPTRNRLRQLGAAPKHHLADPALAARLLGIGVDGLLEGVAVGPPIRRDGTLLGALFESLVTLSVKVYAQANGARVGHLRTHRGTREIDLIVERDDQRVVAIEVKLGRLVGDDDVRHLLWLQDQIGHDLLDMVVVTSGPEAYRRRDGVAVVPAALLDR